MKYEYKIVRIPAKITTLFIVRSTPTQDYRDVIDEYSSKGWRFVQAFAFQGVAKFIDLIFERPINQQSHQYQ